MLFEPMSTKIVDNIIKIVPGGRKSFQMCTRGWWIICLDMYQVMVDILFRYVKVVYNLFRFVPRRS